MDMTFTNGQTANFWSVPLLPSGYLMSTMCIMCTETGVHHGNCFGGNFCFKTSKMHYFKVVIFDDWYCMGALLWVCVKLWWVARQ